MSFQSQRDKQSIREMLQQTEQQTTQSDASMQVVSDNSTSLFEPTEAEGFYGELAKANHQDLVDDLRVHQENIVRIWVKTGFELGREYALAQAAFKKSNMPGRFDDWVKATGYSPRTARSLISIFTASEQLSGSERDLFEALPRELQRRISSQIMKPDDKKDEAAQAAIKQVFEGDIKSLPDFQKALAEEKERLEKDAEVKAEAAYQQQLKDARNEAIELKAQLDDTKFEYTQSDVELSDIKKKYEDAQAKIEELEANPLVRVPEDYEQLKADHDAVMDEVKRLKASRNAAEIAKQDALEKIDDLKDRLETTARGDGNHETLQNQIKQAEVELERKQKALIDIDYGARFVQGANELLDKEIGPLLMNVAYFEDPALVASVMQIIKRLNNVSEMLTDKLPAKAVIEGNYHE